MVKSPTPYPDVNTLVIEVFDRARPILQDHFIGMYLDGSLAAGGFDEDSDIDFVVVTDTDITGDLFITLQAMHDQIAQLDSVWAIQLEGSYISLPAVRHYDPEHTLHPNIERGEGERLKMAVHDQTWDVHRSVLRDQGIVVEGPDPQTLIDPVTPAQLEQAMRLNLSGWATGFLAEPSRITHRGYQSFIVLSLCRILYTLQNGAVVPKPVAVDWARENLPQNWRPLIESAWEGRHLSSGAPLPDDLEGTLALIRYTLNREL